MTPEELERKRDWVRGMFARKHLREYMAAINLDALNDYYGFHAGRCPCIATSSSENSDDGV
jgi:hypothetical protein